MTIVSKITNKIFTEVERMKRVSTLSAIFTALSFIYVVQLYPNEIAGFTDESIGTSTGYLFVVIFSLFVALRFFASSVLGALKQGEETLQIAEASMLAIKQLRIFLDNSDSAVLATDEKGRIVLVNNATVKLFNSEIYEFIGKKIFHILKLKRKGKEFELSNYLEKIIKGTIKVNIKRDLVLETKNGKKSILFYASPVFKGNEYGGVIIILRDISEEIALQKKKEEFIALTSHELRTPLTIIEGYLYPVLNKRKITNVEREYLRKAHKASRDLTKLVAQLLIVSKDQNQELEIFKEKILCSTLLDTVFEENKKDALMKKINLEINVSKISKLKINTDKVLFLQIFNNLVENAIKFTALGSVKIVATKNKKEILISICDTGKGISAEEQKRIFSQFYQTEDWQTREKGGVGLGLYIVKLFTERLGGKIYLESKENKGTCFRVSLPIN